MRSLAAEDPDGLGVLDHDGEYGQLALVGASLDRLESRLESRAARCALGQRLARVVEVGLRDGVVAVEELELDHGAGLGCDLLGVVLETGLAVDRVLSYGNDLNVDGWLVLLVSCWERQAMCANEPCDRPARAASERAVSFIVKMVWEEKRSQVEREGGIKERVDRYQSDKRWAARDVAWSTQESGLAS